MAAENTNTKTPIYKRKWILASIFVVVLLILFFVTLPIGAKWYISRWLERNGAEEATIEHLWFNPMSFKLVVEGITVKDDGKTQLSNGRMVINLTPWPLFKKNINLQNAIYRDLFIAVEQNDDSSWDFGAYHYTPDEDPVDNAAEEAASHWNLFAEQALFENITIVLKAENLDFKLVIDSGELHRITTWEGGPVGTLKLSGSLNDSPFEIDLPQVELVPYLNIAGNVSLNSFELNQLANLFSDSLSRLGGGLDLKGEVSLARTEKDSMKAQFNGDLAFQKVDIANSNFTSSAQRIGWLGKAEYVMSSDSDKTISANGSLELDTQHFSLEADQTVIDVAGALAEGDLNVKLNEIVAVSYKGTLETETTEVKLPEAVVGEEQLNWNGEFHYTSQTKDSANDIKSDGSLDIRGIHYHNLKSDSESFSVKSHMNWSGKLAFDQPDSHNLIDIQGSLTATDTQISIGSPQLSIKAPTNSFELDYQLAISDAFETTGLGSVTLEKIALHDETAQKQIAGIDRFNIAQFKGLGKQGLEAENIEAMAIHASIPGSSLPIEARLQKLSLPRASSANFTTFNLSELDLSSFQATAVNSGTKLAELESLSLSDITLGSDCAISVHTGNLKNLLILNKAGEASKPALELGSANLFSLCYTSDEIPRIDTLYLNDLKASLHRNSNGDLDIMTQFQEILQDDESTPSSEVTDDDTSSEPFKLPLYIREFVVKGDSQFHYRDDSLPKPFNSQLDIETIELLGLDSDESDQKIHVTFTGELERRAPVTLTGNISPFDKELQLDLELTVKNYPVKNLSGYTITQVGTELSSGQLQIDSTIKLDGKQLDMQNELLIKKLKTKEISEDLVEEFNSKLPIPLDAALSMLRDKQDNISLNIPVSGAVDEIDIDITDLFVTAISKAVIPATTGYLTYALGPYAALAYVGYKVGEKVLEISLPPIQYEYGQTDIPEGQEEYLERVADILKDKEQRDLQLCPWVSAGELGQTDIGDKTTKKPALDQQATTKLHQLGQKRAQNLKQFFVQKHSIAGNRLLICDTALLEDKEALSEVRLQL